MALPGVLLGQTAGVVDGAVVNSVTRAAIAGMEVGVRSTASRDSARYVATTDANGAFHIEDIRETGAFRADSGGPGFMPMSKAFEMAAAGTPVRLQLEVTPMPKLRGRVVDPEGHPVPDATVQLVHLGGGGRPNAISGKDGSFVFEGGLLPTSVLLWAIPPRGLEPPKSAEGEPEIWAPTYFPDVTDRLLARTVTLLPGDDLEYEIKLCAAPVFHVRGVVVDDDDKPVAGATVTLVSPDALDARSHAAFEEPEARTKTAEDGAFDLPGVRPGDWHLIANGKRGGQPLSAAVTGTVSKSDWENVRIHVKAPFTVKGTVERLSKPKSGSRHTWVALLPAWQVRLMGTHDDTGAFEIDEVISGKYEIRLEAPLPGFYVDSLLYGGRDAMGQTVDVMDGSLPIHVVYKSDGGSVQGSVEKCSGGTVVLLPKERALQNSEYMHWGRCDANGRFHIGDLRPGIYSAAAFDRLEMFDLSYGLYYGGVVDPLLIAAIAERGTGVRVESGQAVTASLAMMPWPKQ